MYDIIIIGAGPAGMTAALYARRAMKNVLVLEALSYGGQIINTLEIDNYPALPHINGFDFATNLYNQIKELECDIKFECVTEIKNYSDYKEVITKDNKYLGKTIIIATGNENRKLGLEYENELIGKGISYCATCDGAFFKGKDVAVVGGGNTAIEDAIYLSSLANKVYLIHRRDEFRAEASLIEILKSKSNIEFIYNSNVTKLNKNEVLESIEITDNNDNKKIIEVSGLFIAIGRIPVINKFTNLINLDDAGYVISNDNCHTNITGIFVAGDARKKDLRQLTTAVSDGSISASEAIKYLNNN